MIQEEQNELFPIRLNEEGKNTIRRFANLSYTLQVLVSFISAVSLYWNIKIIVDRAGLRASGIDGFYFRILPYANTVIDIGILAANTYSLSFPRALYKSILVSDEVGANRAFKRLLRSGYIFLLVFILNAAELIWSLLDQPIRHVID